MIFQALEGFNVSQYVYVWRNGPQDHHNKRRDLRNAEEKGETVYTTTISVGEYFTDAYRSRGREWRSSKAREFLKAFVPLTPDHESARLWGQLAAELKSNAIGDLDLLEHRTFKKADADNQKQEVP